MIDDIKQTPLADFYRSPIKTNSGGIGKAYGPYIINKIDFNTFVLFMHATYL